MEKSFKIIELVLLACALLAILSVAVSVVHSFDVFWQLQSGRYMAETGSIINKDVFTLASDLPRYEHCWLHDLALYLIYLLGGYAAISVWKGIMILSTTLLLIGAAKTRGSSLTAILVVLPLLFLTAGGWLERPQLWTFLFFAWFVFCLERYRVTQGKIIYSLFPVMIFWVNAHAGAVLGILIVGAYLAGALASNLLKERKFGFPGGKRFALASVLVVIGACLTTYSTRWIHLLMNTSTQGAKISESGKKIGDVTKVFNMDWTPTTFAAEPVFYYAIAVAAVLLLLSFKKLEITDVFLLGGLAIMGLSLVRHVPFFYFGCLAILPRYLDSFAALFRRFLKPRWASLATLVLLAGVVFWFWILYQPQYRVYGLFNTGLREWHYPIEATEFVREHKLPANIYNTYDWGGYMEWQLFPEYKMFWDGRQISKKMFQLGWNVMAGKPDWQQILDKFDVNTIVSRSSTIDTGQLYPLLDRLRTSEDWSLVFNSESSMVFVRRGSVPEEWLARFAKPKSKMDDTILSEARLMVSVNPGRYMAWWEMARVYLNRKQYPQAYAALRQHLARAPGPRPQAQKIFQDLTNLLQQRARPPKS